MSLEATQYDSMFSGIIGQNYDTLKQICPLATEMSRLVGVAASGYPASATPLKVVELGGGTGITTLSLLTARADLTVFSVDKMMNQKITSCANPPPYNNCTTPASPKST